MISALRGWRRKRRQTVDEFIREFDIFTKKRNKRALMVKVNGISYGRLKLLHNGRKP